MKIIWIATVSQLLLFWSQFSQANCFWEVSTRLMGQRPASTIAPARNWPLVNMETRLQTRTPGGWWSTASWPIVRTNVNGDARIRSNIAFADPVCQLEREFRVQIRSFDTNGQWRTVHQETESAHNDHSGLFIPAPVHRVAVGNLVLGGGNISRDGVIFIQGLTEPPIELTSANDGNTLGDPQIVEKPVGEQPGVQPEDEPVIVADDDPCRMYRSAATAGIEFRFGQMSAQPGPLSSDSALRIETRPNGGGTMTLNRLTAHIAVENAGSRDFIQIEQCIVSVQVRLNEGPGERGGDGWSNPWSSVIPGVARNQSQPVAVNLNLLGSGDDLAGDWGQPYEFVLVEVQLDSSNEVPESAEGDNMILHCYHAPSNQFTNMSNCEM